MANSDIQLWRTRQVLAAVGFRRTKLHELRLAEDPAIRFPAPVMYLTERMPLWKAGDVVAWIERQVARQSQSSDAGVQPKFRRRRAAANANEATTLVARQPVAGPATPRRSS